MGLSKYAAPLLLLAMFLPCFIAFCTRPMSDAGMSFMDIMFVRLSIASAGLFLIVLVTHRSLKPLKPNRRDIVMLVFFAAMMGALYFNETMDVQDYIGIIMLASSIVLIRRQTDIEKREKAKSADP